MLTFLSIIRHCFRVREKKIKCLSLHFEKLFGKFFFLLFRFFSFHDCAKKTNYRFKLHKVSFLYFNDFFLQLQEMKFLSALKNTSLALHDL
jgi:hypothetical protein